MARMLRKVLHFALLGTMTSFVICAADPTYLRRSLADVQPKTVDLSTSTAQYKPLFGVGDPDQKQLKGIARYGELTVAPAGTSELVSYPAEEQIYYVLDGNGVLLYDAQKVPVKRDDFMYLPVGVKHGMANSSNAPVRVMVMGFKIPAGVKVAPTPKLMIANADDAKLVPVGGHGPTSLFKLLMGQTSSTRDVLPAAVEMVSLFIMDFAPGGTNIPHHHDTAEEIYYVLRGHGDIVAGGGADGNEGRYPAKEGDAYFYRLNTTVGFYSGAKAGEPHDLILAVRSLYPFPKDLSKQ
jgi:mannose-6-phosphate isomerase-like protein (cupin superfamily)